MPHAKSGRRDTFGRRLRRLREECGFRQSDLAREIGVSKVTLWKWETDQALPRARSLERLDEVLSGPAAPASSGSAVSQMLAFRSPGDTLVEALEQHKSQIADLAGTRPEDVAIRISFGNWNIDQ